MMTVKINYKLIFFFFFNDTATTEIYTLSLPDALPIYDAVGQAIFDGYKDGDTCWKFNSANPYVRVPVILDDYTKNRDIWKCPSAHDALPADWIVPQKTAIWWQYLVDNRDKWGNDQTEPCAGGPCCGAWPPGWGGDVTDSI